MAQAMHQTPGFRPGIGKKKFAQTRRARALKAAESVAPGRLVDGARKRWDAAAAVGSGLQTVTNPVTGSEVTPDPLTRHEARETYESGQLTESFGVLIQGAVMLAVGIFVVISVFGAIPDGGEDAGPLHEAQVRTEELTGQAFEIAPIVLIVIVAFVIMQYVRGM